MLANRSIPKCTVLPELAYPDVSAAVDWLCRVFGFTLRIRIANHRAQLNVGDGAVILNELSGPEISIPLAHSVMVRIEDVDRHWEHAVQCGARIVRHPADHPYGERQYSVADHVGRIWTFSQSIKDVDPKDWGGTTGQL
jgi:uncharacterized glyoxalase superfamily protein PhnB